MTGRRWQVALIGVGLAVLAVVSYTVVPRMTTTSIVVEFASTTGLYVGDDVRIMGVDVGTVASIEPRGDHAEVQLRVDSSRPVPADAIAVIVSHSLVASRFVQLAPAYTGGPMIDDGQRIPISRTAVPVEWDQIKAQLSRVADALGTAAPDQQAPLGALVDAADANLRGQGQNLATTLVQLSDALKTLSDGRTDLFAVVRNLQVFVSALSASGQQIVNFNDSMASITEVLGNNSEQIGSALTALDVAVGDVQRFVSANRDGLDDTLRSLQTVVGELAAQRDGIAQVLHVAPTALSNLNNIYQPAHNAIVSALAPNNFANPMDFICSAIAAAEEVGAQEGANLCVQYLGPLLKTLAFDYLPLSTNPIHGVGALPDQLVYSESALEPTASAPAPSPASLTDLLLPGGGQ
ncbi:MAG: MCE family protein [Rhodococcus sp. (in: high G+C Gram-positive bacteria)]|jgi:phospholipid/cholesterol/gamma-HCH transport system substrate-binding protein|uniref:MCE family protein n=1 Tax=Rhodococcus sp. EPR-157 TaxID=1813677 RepID=UPI0007BB333C|nr:MCE family protein [Rhodococcus sp. EPR-157]KZF12542.1 mammalian cell entry protein [Rhodococcus sp. EPR-157]